MTPAARPRLHLGRGDHDAGHPRGDPGRRHDPGTSPRCRSRRPTARSPCTRTRSGMFEGLASRDKDPRKSLHVERRAGARGRAGRGAGRGDGQRDQLQHRLDVDLRADVDLRLPEALRPDLAARRPSTTSPTTWSARTCPASSCAPGRACTPGSPATRWSRTACRSSSSTPDGHDDTMLDPRAADLGLRDELRRPGRARPGQGQPADAQAGPPDLGGGRLPRAGQLHGVPAAGLAQRRRASSSATRC